MIKDDSRISFGHLNATYATLHFRTLMLAICVAAALVQNGFYTCFVMIFGLFLGPSLSILGELQKARGQDIALRETEERFRIKGLQKPA